MKHRYLVLLAFLACSDPTDRIFEPANVPAIEVAPGLLRLTTNAGGDFVRGTESGGRVRYIANALPGAAPVALRAIPIDGGRAVALGGVYGSALPGLFPEDYSEVGGRRILLALAPPSGSDHYCGDISAPAPAPAFVAWRLYLLPATDGAAFASLFRREVQFPVIQGRGLDPTGRPITPKRIRIVPAMADAEQLGTRAFGPAVEPSGTGAFLSDGETVWRYDLTDSSVAPAPVVAGAYPALSADGAHLFVSQPVVTDSSETVTVVPYGFFNCTQTIVRYTADSWWTVRVVLATGAQDTIGAGAEGVVMGDSAMLVRRPDGLHVLRLSDGSSRQLLSDPTATSPAFAQDGSFLAFTSRRFGNPDVMVQRID